VSGDTRASPGKKKGPLTEAPAHRSPLTAHQAELAHAVKLLPHPQPPVAFGLLNVNPEPCMDDT
jgi:hypothetical protein